MMSDIGNLLTQTANAIKSVVDPYQITVNSVSAGGEEQSMGYEQIMAHLHGLKPEEVAQAAESFRQLGDTLNTMATRLASAGDQLAGQWSGAAAAKAMTRFQELHDQTATLAAQAHTTAGVMKWVGGEVMPQFQQLQSPQVMSGGQGWAAGSVAGPGAGIVGAIGGAVMGAEGKAKADQAARQYMSTLNQHLVQANQMLPPSTTGPAAWHSRGNTSYNLSNHGGSLAGTGAGSSGGAGYSGSGGGVGGGGGGPFAAQTSAGHFSASTPSASLQGYAPPQSGGGAVSPYGGGAPSSMATGGGSANPFSRMPMVPGGGTSPGGVLGEKGLPGESGIPGESALGKGGPLGKSGLPGKGVPGEGMPGESGLAPGAAGDAGGSAGAAAAGDAASGAAGEAAGAAGAGAGEAGGMGAMPMGGAGGGQQEKERQRQAWLHEDDNIWGLPDEEIGPIIG